VTRVFLLSGPDYSLAREEVIAVTGIPARRLGRLLLVSGRISNLKIERLALTKAVYKLLFVCSRKNISKRMGSFDWGKVYRGNFAVSVVWFSERSTGIGEAELAGHIWRKVKQPKVNLKNPATNVHLFIFNGYAVCALLERELHNPFEARKAHRRPAMLPASLHPKLARAMVNMTGIQQGVVVDPFCGTGGILIEAGLMGLKAEGYDLDNRMIRAAEINLRHANIRNFMLSRKDSRTLNSALKYVVTDMPYAREEEKGEKRICRRYMLGL